MSSSIPSGFQQMMHLEGFIGLNGPYYWRRDGAGQLEFGFQTDARHSNPHGVVHGGALVGFLDTILGYVVVDETRMQCATITLEGRFITAVPVGPWISGRATIRGLTRSLAFLEAEAKAEEALLATASAIFRLFRK